MLFFLYPLKTTEKLWFSNVFRAGIETEQWHEKGYYDKNYVRSNDS